MTDILVHIVLGWPAIVLSSGVAIYGLVKTNYRHLVAAALLALPFSWYLSGFPIIRSPIFLLPLLLFGSGYAMSRGHEMISWFLAVPFFLTILMLFMIILAGNS